jgi:hypothetical protein
MGLRVSGYYSLCTVKTGSFGDASVGYFGGWSLKGKAPGVKPLRKRRGSADSKHGFEDQEEELKEEEKKDQERLQSMAMFPKRGNTNVFAAGSDDYRAYAWEIPPVDILMDYRKPLRPYSYWNSGKMSDVYYVTNAGEAYLPAQITAESFVCSNHRSIVNSVLFHPRLPMVATAGVEKVVRLFSPFPFNNDGKSFDLCIFLQGLLTDMVLKGENPLEANPRTFRPRRSLMDDLVEESTEEDVA